MKPTEAKQLSEYPEFLKIEAAVQRLQSERAAVTVSRDQIGIALSQPRQQVDGAEQAWKGALEGNDSCKDQVDDRSQLRDEQVRLDGRLRFLDEALSVGMMELDRIRGRCSLQICATVRLRWVEQIRLILGALKTISESNQRLDVIRAELERDGVVTGTLPYSKYDIGGTWSDPYGGRVVAYQREASENFPEVSDVAGHSVKLKIKALVERERKFAARSEEGATE